MEQDIIIFDFDNTLVNSIWHWKKAINVDTFNYFHARQSKAFKNNHGAKSNIELAEYFYENDVLTYTPVIYENFGTVMFRLIDFPDIELEAVHTRKETYRGDSRKPETAFGTIEEDCQRRASS